MSNSQGLGNMQEIVELVRLLRQNGDKVLSASSKLSLSTMLLYNLNEAFSLIVDESEDLESSFQVCSSSKIDIFRDIKFLHDFVQKTLGLKLAYYSNNPKVSVDITKFRHLKYLELKKVCIELVKGLQGVRGQLESVICAGGKGVSTVSQLLAACGGDAGVGFVWASLRHLALPHNALEQLDTSLELAPWLQVIDLSHNLITSADELSCLSNLKYVNLGYNKIETVPVFNKAACHHLQVLVLKNNYIENINGLQGLEYLTELDLSYNCLMEHSSLWPLEKMSALLWVSLEGNPLSYHPKHRLLSIKRLHPCLSDSKFVLDHLQLSKTEKQIITENRPFTIRSEQSASKELLTSVSSSMYSSFLTTSINTSTVSEITVESEPPELVDKIETNFPKIKKKPNMKEAIITEDELGKKESSADSSVLSSSYLETSKDHLETKKQILALREKFGEDNWLSSRAGTFVQDIMGLQPPMYPISSSTPTMKTLDDASTSSNVYDRIVQSVTDAQMNVEEGRECFVKEGENGSKDEEEKSVNLSDDEENSGSMSVNGTMETLENIPEPLYDPEEEKGDLYLVQKKKNENDLEELFLVITADDIKERDAVTGRVKYSWSTSSVLSCILGRSEPITVDIIFDTTREDRQNRRYFVELEDARKIVTTIGERMRSRPIFLKVFKCMKCSTHFSQDTEYMTVMTTSMSGAKQLKCPTCESTLVIQTDELTTLDTENEVEASSDIRPTKEQASEFMVKPHLQHSESYSSIGSATSLEESRESTPSANALNKKYESDIEVLSNPSQSSIEVLDEASRTHLTPHRKRSSEERRTAVAPSLLTIPDTTPIMTGLTESSSSGSLTDSICTAYENKMVKHTNSDDKSHSNNPDKDTKFAPVTNLTSMLGGLLQSIKIGSNKPLPLKAEDTPVYLGSNIEYSYTDFSSVDHRIKLHIILNIFEHKNEELVLLLRADILMHSMRESFPGCLILSTSKVYILRIDGSEGEDPQRWLHKEASWTIDRLRSFEPLPFKQGVLIELQQPPKLNEENSNISFLCILQDFQRTSSFLLYIADLSLLANCDVIHTVIQDYYTTVMHNLVKTFKNNQYGYAVKLLGLFSTAELKSQDDSVELKSSGIVVTASALVILQDNMQWLLPHSNELPAITKEQAMSNLIAIEHYDATLTLNFLDEVAGLEESWTLNFISSSAAEAVIDAVQPPWEKLFSVPLQIMTSKEQEISENA